MASWRMSKKSRNWLCKMSVLSGAIASVSLFPTQHAMGQTNGTWIGPGSGNYSNTALWSGGTVASGVGANATVNMGAAGATTITLDTNQTIGEMFLTNSGGTSFAFNGTSTSTLTMATTTGTPSLELHSYFDKVYEFSNLAFAGNQGLLIDTGSNEMSLNGTINWTGFSGAITIAQGCALDNNNGGTLPDVDINLGTVTGSDGNSSTGATLLGMFGGRNQTIGALNGNATAFLNNNSTSTTSTITIGADNDNGTFAGVIGANSLHPVYGSGLGGGQGGVNVVMTGTGTETISGVISNSVNASSTPGEVSGVTVQSGLLVLSGSNTYLGATNVQTGQLNLIAGGALSDTAISVSSGATLFANAGYTAGDSNAGSLGASLNLQGGSILDLADGTVGNLNLLQEASYTGTALTLGGATLEYDLTAAGADDVVVSTGNVSASGDNTVTLNTAGDSSLTLGSYPLISATAGSLSASSGAFLFSDSLPTEDLTVGSNTYALSLSSSSDQELLTISAVPEPTAGMLVIGALALGLLSRHRRNNSNDPILIGGSGPA